MSLQLTCSGRIKMLGAEPHAKTKVDDFERLDCTSG